MRLPTVNQFKNEINTLSNQFEQIKNLQSQISTGKKLQHSSENPLLADRIKAVSDFIQNIKGYELNGTLAEQRTTLLNSTTQESINLVGRIQELIQSAQNDTLNNTDRLNIATELKSYVDTLVGIANTQDNNGEYIYSGINVSMPPYTKIGSTHSYQGAQEATHIPLGANVAVPYNESGYRVFGNIKSGNGVFSVSSDSLNNTGTGIASSNGLVKNTVFIPDEYTITFVTNNSGKLAYQVLGNNSGQLIPAPPLSAPNDAPEFLAGSDIQFNGVNLQISGTPNAGDVFGVQPSKTQNIFDTLQGVINTLNTPVNSDKDKANLHQALGEDTVSFKQIHDHFSGYLTELGNRGKIIDDQITIGKNLLVDQRIVLGKLSDADMGEVVSDLTQRLSALEITQQSYLKIQETFYHLLKR